MFITSSVGCRTSLEAVSSRVLIAAEMLPFNMCFVKRVIGLFLSFVLEASTRGRRFCISPVSLNNLSKFPAFQMFNLIASVSECSLALDLA